MCERLDDGAGFSTGGYDAPVPEPLTDEQVQILRRQLLKKGAEINEKLTRLLNGQKVDINALLGGGKAGESPIERLRHFLALVDGRIQAIRAGRYGRCESCGAPLPFPHLQQIPWIDTCGDCARKQSPP